MSAHMKTDSNSQEIESISNALKAFPYLSLAIVFGSVAAKTARFESDVDLAVQAEKTLTTQQKLRSLEQ